MTVDPRAVVADEDAAAKQARALVVARAIAQATYPLHQQIADLQQQLADCQGGGGPTRVRPDESNTGADMATDFTVVTDHQPVTGGRYRDLDIRNVPQSKNGCTDVEYDNCIFRGSETRPGGACGLLSLIRDTHAGGFTLRRCTFRPTTPDYRWVGVHGWGVHLIECDISGVTDPMQVFRTDGQPDADCEVIVESCYFHDQAYFAPGGGGGETSSNGSHSDDIQWQGGTGLEVMWSYFTGMLDPAYQPNYVGGNQSNAAMMMKPDAGKIGGGRIHDNWFGGGAVTLNIADAPNKGRYITDIGEIVRNTFYKTQYYPPTNIQFNDAGSNIIGGTVEENYLDDGSVITITRKKQ